MIIRLKSRLPLTILLLFAVAGSVLGFIELHKAIVRCQSIYRLDTLGSQIESDLEYSTQESRRAFLYALGIEDVNEQLAYVDAAHAAESSVSSKLREFRALPGADQAAASRFEQAWKGYLDVREQIVARILEGDEAAAIRTDRETGNAAFDNSISSLHSMRNELRAHARARSDEVDTTLKECIAGLLLSMFASVLFISQLLSIKKDREEALKQVEGANRDLEFANNLGSRRAAILEMVSKHASLDDCLLAVAEIAHQHGPFAGCAIWACNTEKDLILHAVSGIPDEWAHKLRVRPIAIPDEPCAESAVSLRSRIQAEAAQYGGQATALECLYSAGQPLGLVLIFKRQGPHNIPAALVALIRQLAAVVIDNSLLFDRLAFQAQHDVLTKLPNRMLFQDRLEQALRTACRNKRPLAVLWIDLDHYKRVNDSLGHRAGDEVLCEAGRRIEGAIRAGDTLARAGGDEFTVLLPDAGSGHARFTAARILSALRLPMQIGEHTVSISASIGISLCPDHGETSALLIRNADLALYEAKHGGRNNVSIFTLPVGESMDCRANIERNLRHAMDAGALHLNYQPLIDRNGRLEALEVLLRWNDHELGSVPPSEFIPIAEEMGLISRIGDWVIRTALVEAARWKELGKEVPLIAVNASSIQFGDRNFVNRVKRILDDTGFPGTCLEIEVTETVLMKDVDLAIEQIRNLRELGVHFSIDDFGTGYSSLNQLRTLPVDTVKIDRSFVTDLNCQNDSSLTLVRGIIGLAHSLNLRVVAEGVETEEQLGTLNQLGCDVNQGYYLHRPMLADSIIGLLHEATQESAQAPEVQDPEPVLAIA